MYESGTEVTVTHSIVDKDSWYACSVDCVARAGLGFNIDSHSNTVNASTVRETIGVEVAYLGHGHPSECLCPV